MSYPLVRALAAEGIPVRLTCGVLGFTAQAYYAWLADPVTDREWAGAHTINALLDARGEDPEFGYRFLVDELEAAGHQTGERRAWRLCSQQRLWSTTTKKGRRGSGKTPGSAVHDDLVERKFSAVAPNLLWLTDTRRCQELGHLPRVRPVVGDDVSECLTVDQAPVPRHRASIVAGDP